MRTIQMRRERQEHLFLKISQIDCNASCLQKVDWDGLVDDVFKEEFGKMLHKTQTVFKVTQTIFNKIWRRLPIANLKCVTIQFIWFLAPIGAQGVTLCVRVSVCPSGTSLSRAVNLNLREHSESTQRALREHSEQRELRVFKSESYSWSLKYCDLLFLWL